MKEENITCDKDKILDERIKEIENSDSYVMIKILQNPLPKEFLKEIANKEDGISLGYFTEKIEDYVQENPDYCPIISIIGEKTSEVNILATLLLSRTMIEGEILETCINIFKRRGE